MWKILKSDMRKIKRSRKRKIRSMFEKKDITKNTEKWEKAKAKLV